ncbi:hypothetical protein PPL_07391 [Heterostelium album PN500]|uniref:PiggyBac transposable element-derived protein domain-containing protein n=1 Tax=Heterostelium pallidum (strain ATCC 26659 / Pp 5 / PN500) TaxID=670386 RepID=D3BFU0_HETP5|nr:hypothetical protein PPL_07391 [Heterostelium album PN500]EFA79700.1 hypothetical protein PPL_07391 [Heterostelium album PN500]|eukprot:XP_020431821.1 hypothetical protein PPL_07391 [Heterostelium album PN500]
MEDSIKMSSISIEDDLKVREEDTDDENEIQQHLFYSYSDDQGKYILVLKEICKSNGWDFNQSDPDLICEFLSGLEINQRGRTDSNVGSVEIKEPKQSDNCPQNLGNLTPFQIFTLFFDFSIIELITTETNLYMDQKGINLEFEQNFQSKCTYEILIAFIGVLLCMGICKMPSFSSYWRGNGEGFTPVRNLMSRNQFTSIYSTIHFANNNQKDPNDIFYKIRPLIRHLESKFMFYWKPTTILSIGEDLIDCRQNHPHLQYMFDQPTKWGFKMFKQVDSKGYLFSFKIHQGKIGQDKSTPTERGCTENHILYLLNHLPKDQKYHICIDNYSARIDTVEDCKENCKGETITKEYPQELKFYRIYSGHVDRNNENTSQHQIVLESRKWWFNIFKYLLSLSIVNSWAIYKEWHTISLPDFIKDITRHISKNYSTLILSKKNSNPKSVSKTKFQKSK